MHLRGATQFGRLAQLVEHPLDVRKVIDSSSITSTNTPKDIVLSAFTFAFDSSSIVGINRMNIQSGTKATPPSCAGHACADGSCRMRSRPLSEFLSVRSLFVPQTVSNFLHSPSDHLFTKMCKRKRTPITAL